MRRKVLLTVLGALGFSAAVFGGLSSPQAYVTETFSYEGNTWEYEWKEGIIDTLAIVMHGGGGSGGAICGKVDLDLDPIGQDWYIACPNSDGNSWNWGEDPAKADDLGFLAALIEDLAVEHSISQVVVIGHSAGGMMGYTLACRHADLTDFLVASGASLVAEDCLPALMVPILHMHGVNHTYQGSTGDKNVPYTCPVEGVPCEQKKSSKPWPAALEGIELWADVNGCSGIVSTPYDDDADVVDYQNCIAPVRVVEMYKGCHGWPGAPRRIFRCNPYKFPGTARLTEWVNGIW